MTGSFDYEKLSRFGIAEVVGSNPTRSISYCCTTTVLVRVQFRLLSDKIGIPWINQLEKRFDDEINAQGCIVFNEPQPSSTILIFI